MDWLLHDEVGAWVFFIGLVVIANVFLRCCAMSACPPEPLVKPRRAKGDGDPIGEGGREPIGDPTFPCPYCGMTMTNGYARVDNSGGEAAVSVEWHDSYPQAGFFGGPKVDTVLWEIGYFFESTSVRCAHRCRACGMVAIEMGNRDWSRREEERHS